MDATPIEELDRVVAELVATKTRWATLDIPSRIALLREAREHTLAAAEGQVKASCKAKGIDFDSPVSAEEWLGGPMVVLKNLRLLEQTLGEIAQQGNPRLKPGAISEKYGRTIAEVYPEGLLDKLMFAGFSAEIWMQPGETAESVRDGMAWSYKEGADNDGKVALVLGAGNVSSIGPMDVLYKLFVENQVCVLKMNPVNEYLGPHVEASLRPLVDGGYLRVVYGGADVGAHLVQHPDVDEIHITGSDAVHDIIVWGAPGEEQTSNKQKGSPKITKRITSELGCVTPVIIVPGEWTPKELQYQAENIATMIANNGSFNCNAAKLIVTSSSWAQREAFLTLLQNVLRTIPRRVTYYPGSDAKYDRFIAAHEGATALGERGGNTLPWTTIFGVDASHTEDVVFTQEAWCAIIAESPLPSSDAADFIEKVVPFCNDHVWGTLSCAILCDPRTQRSLGSAFDKAIADLRYGGIGVNQWPATVYGLTVATWGAHPGHTLESVVSGIGVVHNTKMFHAPQKSVVRGPFTMSPKPPWFSTHKNGHRVARKVMAFEYCPSFWKFPGIAIAALKG